jgi:glycosyltransferase domain-containing protein
MKEVRSEEIDTPIDLSSLTMVFITRNRQDLLLRNSRLYQTLGATVLILDGSDSPITEMSLSGFAKPNKYIYAPENLEQRFKRASEFIQTPFTIVSTDDDLLVPSGLQKSIDFLRCHPKIMSCSGRTLGFKRTPSGLAFIDCYPEHDDLNNSQLPGSLPLRVIRYFRTYSSRYFYSVYRSEDWIPIFTKFNGEKTLPRNYLELIIEFRACLKGSHRILPDLFWLRNFTNPPIRAGEKYRNFAQPKEYIDVLREVFSNSIDGAGGFVGPNILKSTLVYSTILALDIRGSLKTIRNRIYHLLNFRVNGINERKEVFELNSLLEKKNTIYSQLEVDRLLLLE